MEDTASLIINCKANGTESIDRMGRSLTGLDGIAKKAMLTLGSVFTVAKIIQFGKQSVMAFQQTQDAAWQFSQTFSNIQKDAEETFNNFSKMYGQSEKSARSMLSTTGDLLKGFGFSQKQALEFAEAAAKVGTDLASYTNYAGGAEGATMALTKAMLGEAESMKSLKVVVSQNDATYKKFFNAFKGGGMSIEEVRKTMGAFSSDDAKVTAQWESMIQMFARGKNMTDQQAKALTALAITVKQQKSAVGDYIKEGESFSQTMQNQGQALQEMMSQIGGMIYSLFNLNETMGTFTEGMKSVTEWIKQNGSEWVFAFQSVYIEIEAGAKRAWEIVWFMIAPRVESIKTGAQNIIAIGQWVYDNIGTILANFPELTTSVLKDIWYMLKASFEQCIDFFVTLGKSIIKAIKAGLKGESLSKAFSEQWEKFGNDYMRRVSEFGANTEKTMKKVGVTQLKLKGFEDFENGWGKESWDKMNKNLDGITKDAEKKQAELATKFQKKEDAKRTGKTNKGDEELTTAAVESNKAIQELAKSLEKFKVTAQDAVTANSVEAIKLQSRKFLSIGGLSTPKTEAQGLADSMVPATNGIKAMSNAVKELTVSLHGLGGTATPEQLKNWGKRFNPETGEMNGDQKREGWRGIIQHGKEVMTEVSVGTEINGKQVEIPLIVPTSTEDDLKRIAKVAMGDAVPDDLLAKAIDFAKQRISENKSPFYNGSSSDEGLRNIYGNKPVGIQGFINAGNSGIPRVSEVVNQTGTSSRIEENTKKTAEKGIESNQLLSRLLEKLTNIETKLSKLEVSTAG